MKRFLFIVALILFLFGCQKEDEKIGAQYIDEVNLFLDENPAYMNDLSTEINKWFTTEVNIHDKTYQRKFKDQATEYNKFLRTFRVQPTTDLEKEIDQNMRASINAQEKVNNALVNYLLKNDLKQLDIAKDELEIAQEKFNELVSTVKENGIK